MAGHMGKMTQIMLCFPPTENTILVSHQDPEKCKRNARAVQMPRPLPVEKKKLPFMFQCIRVLEEIMWRFFSRVFCWFSRVLLGFFFHIPSAFFKIVEM